VCIRTQTFVVYEGAVVAGEDQLHCGWPRFVDAELNHRYIRVWIGMAQNRPGSVIESPILRYTHLIAFHQALNTSDQPVVARGGILNIEKFGRESSEIMDCAGEAADSDGSARLQTNVPISRVWSSV
jgi:hypothetical protein